MIFVIQADHTQLLFSLNKGRRLEGYVLVISS